MADTRALLQGLEDYLQQFEKHASSLEEDYEHLHHSWINLSFNFQGDAADQFTAQWEPTIRVFQEYIERSHDMRALLREKIADLTDANSPEDPPKDT